MEGKILKWTTWCFGLLTFVMCTTLYLLPRMEGDVTAEAPAIPNSNTNSNNHHVLQETPIKIDREEVLKEDKLNIELPKGVKEEDVQIVNDYMNNTVYVRFAKAVDDYSEKYMVRGSSDHIANLSYYKEETEGVLEIKLDKACEHFYDYKDGFLRMELKDLREVYDKIVVIDAGHGDTHPGATKKDICEKDLNLDIVLALKALLDEPEQKKVKALYTRLEDINPSLEERADMANKMEADLFISVHNNSSTDGKFSSLNGTMVLYSQKQSADESKRFAQICLENVIESIGSENLGLVKGDDIYIIRSSHVPVALIEVGYMTNVEELEKLCDEEYQKKVAQGIYDAMMQAFEEGF